MTMMQTQLTMKVLMDRGPLYSPDIEIVSKMRDGVHRHTYAQIGTRARQLAKALQKLGVERGDRVATLAWNNFRHLELYNAVPNMGAVLHTLNLRLAPDQLAYVINHAEDKIICIDEDLLPLLERIAGGLTTVQNFIIMSNSGEFKTGLPNALNYETLLAAESADFEWPDLDENTPMGLCYTSGTTGNPKGAMYTHRSNYLHALASALPDNLGLTRQDTIMAVVPMFHANAWGLPYIATMIGAKQVFPGATMDGASICQLIQDEKVNFTAGVPTIWLGVKNEIVANPGKYDLSSLKTMVCGGSAPPRALIEWLEDNLNIEFIQAWGMTETSPLGTVARIKPAMREWDRSKVLDVKQRAGVVATGLEIRIEDDNGNEVPNDGVSMGKLLIRGPWIASEYYKADAEDRFPNGWFDTGDIATMDSEGYMGIADRAKDVIKSGGEWISSVDMENMIMAMPGVLEAAVIGVNHTRWQERPLACVVKKPDTEIDKEAVLKFLEGKIAKWWTPDDVVFIEMVPKTSVGKFDKKVLRAQFENHLVEN